MAVRTFEDIEADRFDRLPAPVYVRGFLLEYARVVGLDPRATAESFLARLPTIAAQEVAAHPQAFHDAPECGDARASTRPR